MSSFADRVTSTTLAIAAIVIAATYAHREFAPQRARRAPAAAPTYVSDWQRLLPGSLVVGDSSAPIKILEFADFECPFCRNADSVYRQVKKTYGRRVALYFLHFPLGIHRFAMPAARAAECAAAEGRFGAFHDALYDKQDSLGLKSWGSFAADAGISDTTSFARCAHGTAVLPRVQWDISQANRLQVTGTPTVLVNGWRFSAPPSFDQLDSTIQALSLTTDAAR
jgi:protein-disulfide isomerase